MPRLFVPKPNRDAIRDLLELDRAVFSSLLSALNRTPEVRGDHLRLANVPVSGVERDKSEDILDTVEMLYRIWSSRGNQALDDFVDDLIGAIRDFYPDGNTPEIETRLRAVLDIEPLARASKALSVSNDHEHIFYDAKILSDIRYAFRPDPKANPYGAAIVHVLKIVYHSEYQHKAFFVALDAEDLTTLKEVIARAEEKTKRLRKDLEVASIAYLGTED